MKLCPWERKAPLEGERERGERVHSGLASVEYKFVSLYFRKQQSRTEQIQRAPLICPSQTPRGGMGGLEKGRGVEGVRGGQKEN